jgi:formate dehydrogenase gamma subunit
VLVMTWTGLLLSVPALSTVTDRPTATAWHLWSAWALVIGAVLLMAVHGRRLRSTVRDLERFSRDDLRWLRRIPRRVLDREAPPPQGRFNAGQKVNAAVTLGLITVLYLTGLVMWLGERRSELRLDGPVIVHDAAMYLLVVLVAGHVWMAVGNPATSPAMRGIVTGWVDRSWARHHHPLWVDEMERSGADGPSTAPSAGRREPRQRGRQPSGADGEPGP